MDKILLSNRIYRLHLKISIVPIMFFTEKNKEKKKESRPGSFSGLNIAFSCHVLYKSCSQPNEDSLNYIQTFIIARRILTMLSNHRELSFVEPLLLT